MEVVLARIGRPHGIRGEVSVEVRTDDPDRRLAPGTTLRTEPASVGPLTIADGWVHSGRLILRFEGYDGRGAAEGLRNVLLVADVDPTERPEDPDEYYDHQLVGLSVRTVDGEPVGELAEVLHLPGQDVLAVRRADGTEALVPFVAAMVPSVDLDAGLVLVDPPPGLLTDVPTDVPEE
jgi:16S rRNA processing protein RimM